MAMLRVGALVRRGIRSAYVAANRSYSNGGDMLPLTFASPTQVWMHTIIRRGALNGISPQYCIVLV